MTNTNKNADREIRLYQVGGSIRDEMMGVKSKDIDYAVEAPSFEAMRDYLVKNNYTIFLETPQYLTIRAKFPNSHEVVDFSLCRTEEGYSDGRRPDLVNPGTILEDLARRDFTVNAIARTIDGEYLDPYHGREDLEARILRCVGSAEERMREDALRSLRAVRFIVTKGFTPDEELMRILQEDWLVELLKTLPSERIRQELERAFAADTLGTMDFLYKLPQGFREVLFKELWLEPTCKKIKHRKVDKH